MTSENPKKHESAKSVELSERVRNAAAFKFASNATDALLAEKFKVSVHTIADWKKRPEWREVVQYASTKQMAETFNEIRAMAPAARDTLFDLMRSGPPAMRMKIAQMICDWAIITTLK